MSTLHVIYGLVHTSRPDRVLYVGSTRHDKKDKRLAEHRSGGSKATKIGAEKDSIPLVELEMMVLRTWESGEEESPEYRVMNTYREAGMKLWGGYGVFTTEANRKGGRAAYKIGLGKRTHEQLAEGGRKSREMGVGIHNRTPEQMARDGRKGYKKSLEKITPEQRVEINLKTNHARWHVNRGIVNPDCALCRED